VYKDWASDCNVDRFYHRLQQCLLMTAGCVRLVLTQALFWHEPFAQDNKCCMGDALQVVLEHILSRDIHNKHYICRIYPPYHEVNHVREERR